MEKVLTIVIPAYNVENYLNETIPHYFDERVLSDIEILIVNDGSKDGTLALANQFHEKYPKSIFVIDKENGGHGSTINAGIVAASGRYFKVIDGDDWVDTESFVKLVKVLKQIDVDLVLTPFERVIEGTEKKEPVTFGQVEYDKVCNFDEVVSQLGDGYQIHSVTFRADILKRIPTISEHCFYVDQEYVLYPIRFVKTVYFMNVFVYQYRIGTAGQSMAIANLQKNRKMHEKVTMNIVRYAEEMKFSENLQTFMNARAAGLVYKTLKILLSMGNNSKEEWTEFAKVLKEHYPSIYQQVPGKKAALLRMTNNALYGVLAKI